MRNFLSLLVFIALLTSCMKGQKVDLIIHNAKIHTMDLSSSVQDAIAIRNGKIVEVGPERQILNKYRSDQTIDAQGKEISKNLRKKPMKEHKAQAVLYAKYRQ